MRLRVLLLIVIALLVSTISVSAVCNSFPTITTEDHQPAITVTYSEEVLIQNIELRKELTNYDLTNQTEDNKTFEFRPAEHLINGDYELSITATDFLGNPVTVCQPFSINAPFMNIWVESPHLGVSSNSSFDLLVKTESGAQQCKYSKSGDGISEPLSLSNTPFNFNLNDGLDHYIYSVNQNSLIFDHTSPDSSGREEIIYVLCEDYYGILHPKELYLAYDITQPSLGVSITPNPITDFEIDKTRLNITTNDRTICTYNGIGFPDYDINNFNSYKKKHSIELDYSHIKLLDDEDIFSRHDFYYNITCTNLAGLEYSVNNTLVTVHYDRMFSITMLSPESYTIDNNIDFEILTGVQTPNGCEVDGNDFDFSTTNNLLYTANLGYLDEGAYSYDITCGMALGSNTETFEFYVDRTPPFDITLNVTSPTCSLSRIRGEVFANDDESGIDSYNYTLTQGGDVIRQGELDEDFSIFADLEDGLTYTLNVVAYDEAGNYVQASIPVVVASELDSNCDEIIPQTWAELSQTADGSEVQVYCLDAQSGCKDLFDYGISTDGSDCELSEFNEPIDMPVLLEDTATFCWTAYDLNNNYASDELVAIVSDLDMDITLINPPYNVSRNPIFDVIIDTNTPANLCKYQANDFSNTFDSLNLDAYFFSPQGITPSTQQIKQSFTEANPTFDMFIKCEDEFGNVNENNPANFLLRYDPTAPIIQQAYASPNPVLQDNFVEFIVRTDDETICKYSNWTSDYGYMLHRFDNWDDWDVTKTPNVNPVFNTINRERYYLQSSSNRSEHLFFVACQNRAGDISNTVNFSFVVDYSQTGYIINTAPIDSIEDTSPLLEVETNKDANCYFTKNGVDYDFENTGNTLHTHQLFGLSEKEHRYLITCDFFSPITTGTDLIEFRVDFGIPIITDIEDGNFACSDEIKPIFESMDASTVHYNYSIWLRNGSDDIQVRDWVYTTSSNPTINIFGFEPEGNYYLKVEPIDSAGHHGPISVSDGFVVKDEFDSVCYNDTTAPIVNIVKVATENGVEISIGCSDDVACADIYYGLTPPEDECSDPNIGYESIILVEESSNFCWEVYDNADNVADGSELILIQDSDGDGIIDEIDVCDETNDGEVVDTNGCSADPEDGDGDGMPDGWEEENGLDPDDPTDATEDPDQDNFDNLEEYQGDSDPRDSNSYPGSDSADSDGDGMPDEWEESFELDPNDPTDATEDPDDDSFNNLEEYQSNTNPRDSESFPGSEESNDSDNDGMPDYWEERYDLDPNDPSDANEDADNDDYTNLEEYRGGTSPRDPRDYPVDRTKDSDNDNIPDYWEKQFNLDPNDPKDAKEDPDDDSFNNLEEYESNTDPRNPYSHPEKKNLINEVISSKNLLPLILIVLGVILVLAGVVYLILTYKKPEHGLSNNLRVVDEKEKAPVEGERAEEKRKTISLKEKLFKKRAEEKKEDRKEILSDFDETVENESRIIQSKAIPKPAVKKVELKKIFDETDEETEVKPKLETDREGYVDLSDLTKEEFDEKDVGSDVFEQLGSLTKKKEENKQDEVQETQSNKLASEVDAEPNKETTSTSEEIAKEVKNNENNDIKDMSNEDVFKKLAELANEDHSIVKEHLDKKEISSEDMMKVFANVTSKKQINADVFKAILSKLLTKGNISKQAISEILFEFLDEHLLSEKEVMDILNKLNLVPK